MRLLIRATDTCHNVRPYQHSNYSPPVSELDCVHMAVSKVELLAELISLMYQSRPWALSKWDVPSHHKQTFPVFHTIYLGLPLFNL